MSSLFSQPLRLLWIITHLTTPPHTPKHAGAKHCPDMLLKSGNSSSSCPFTPQLLVICMQCLFIILLIGCPHLFFITYIHTQLSLVITLTMLNFTPLVVYASLGYDPTIPTNIFLSPILAFFLVTLPLIVVINVYFSIFPLIIYLSLVLLSLTKPPSLLPLLMSLPLVHLYGPPLYLLLIPFLSKPSFCRRFPLRNRLSPP